MERLGIGVVLTLYLLLLVFGMKESKKIDKYICKCKAYMGCGEVCCTCCICYSECQRNCGGNPDECGQSTKVM
jgi:hypothetical protein